MGRARRDSYTNGLMEELYRLSPKPEGELIADIEESARWVLDNTEYKVLAHRMPFEDYEPKTMGELAEDIGLSAYATTRRLENAYFKLIMACRASLARRGSLRYQMPAIATVDDYLELWVPEDFLKSLRTRTRNALMVNLGLAERHLTVRDITEKTRDELMEMGGLGKRMAEEIYQEVLRPRGLAYRGE